MVTAFPTDSLRQGNEMPVSAKGLKMLIYMPMVGKTIRHGKLKQKSKKKKKIGFQEFTVKICIV